MPTCMPSEYAFMVCCVASAVIPRMCPPLSTIVLLSHSDHMLFPQYALCQYTRTWDVWRVC